MARRPVRILIGGDWILKRPWPLQPRSERSRAARLLRRMKESDLTVVNLEMPLSSRGRPMQKSPNTVSLRGDPVLARDLKRFGIGAVSIANNHAMDYGPVALRDTIRHVRRQGIQTFGGGDSLAEALEPLAFTKRGLRVGIFGLACTLPPGSAARPRSAGVAPIRVLNSMEIDPYLLTEQPGSAPRMRTAAMPEDVERACQTVADARDRFDVRIAFVHWGVPPSAHSTFLGQDLADYQRPLGHALVDAGADAVVGCHSHALHGIEFHRGKPIAYGLGTMLLESGPWFISREALLIQLDVAVGGVVDARLLPVLKSAHGLPYLPTAREAAAIMDAVRARSRHYGTRIERATHRVLVPPARRAAAS